MQDLKIFYSNHFVLPLPLGHRFPMVKYSMLRERVAASGICAPGELRVPRPVSDAEILRSHEGGYLERVVSGTLTRKEMRRIGFLHELVAAEGLRRRALDLAATVAAMPPGPLAAMKQVLNAAAIGQGTAAAQRQALAAAYDPRRIAATIAALRDRRGP